MSINKCNVEFGKNTKSVQTVSLAYLYQYFYHALLTWEAYMKLNSQSLTSIDEEAH